MISSHLATKEGPMKVEEKLKSLGLTLPEPSEPLANYVTAVLDEPWLYTSGAGCFEKGKLKYQGRVGGEVTLEEGYDAARVTMLNLLSTVKSRIGDLDRIERVVKVLGFVNSAPDFHRQPEVINGASDLLVELFGDRGRHARSAIGTCNLPMNIPVEIEMIVKVKPGRARKR
jgi:enamine deaminase RidA (YjgF/YER057c/UK114 family)